MEGMEVDQCAGATAGSGGGLLRRSNSAPMISGVSDGLPVFSPTSSTRHRRSSISVNPSFPVRGLPQSSFSLVSEKPDPKRQVRMEEESMELSLRGNYRLSHDHDSLEIQSLDSSVTPNSSPSPARRFRGVAPSPSSRRPVLTALKRKGGLESDGPPKKLFVAGVTASPHLTGYAVSVTQAADPASEEVSVTAGLLALYPPVSFASDHPNV
ncbi:P2R1A-PPP2R2A-interacting phosphatase regulator 1-like isoform X2 [Brienomyrus brachyistius]|uniref:P2R1A-PPP2R2A-interacting phosphatase regulator 1-like isoform X2 n=1 Tax=Brienomyrus brachyistius TaxID=42636 RepID=UPI0020B38CCF|nr:P2R1A-PPP2R2A-interacting phosphatase regulator 1-like isoform X2 [Brienomyrus brachyistius]